MAATGARSLAALTTLVIFALATGANDTNHTGGVAAPSAFEEFQGNVQQMMDDIFSRIPPSLMRQLQQAEISPTCTIGLLRMMRGFRNLQPWALRLFDASGKYPTGAFDGAKSDIGAFDECLETVVRDDSGHVSSRAHYCSLVFYIRNGTALEEKLAPIIESMHPRLRAFKEFFFRDWFHAARIGLCLLDDCSQADVQALINAVKPSLIDIEVTHCVNTEPVQWTAAKKGIAIFMATLSAAIAVATATDILLVWKGDQGCKRGVLIKCVVSFAVTANTRALLSAPQKGTDAYSLRFLHGMRYLSLCLIVLGHCAVAASDTYSHVVAILVESSKWPVVFLASSFSCVDTFFFLSGFLLGVTVMKHKHKHTAVVLLVLVLRYARTILPLVVFISAIYLVPLTMSGPDLITFTRRFYHEISEHWWHLLLQMRNFYAADHKSVLAHLWYISADFQLFMISLPILVFAKQRRRLAIGIFVVLSLAACAAVTWQIAGNGMPPFVMFLQESPELTTKTITEYYFRPYYHAVCYFAGCITFLSMKEFTMRKLPKALNLAGWCLAAACGLCCLFVKLPWYTSRRPTTELGKLPIAFFERILWSLSISWVTLACVTGRGGFVKDFLACKFFVPLGRLTYGVYLIHLPLIEIVLHVSRERVHYSPWNVISFYFSASAWSLMLAYLLYLACEAPLARLSKVLIEASCLKPWPASSQTNGTKKELSGSVTKA